LQHAGENGYDAVVVLAVDLPLVDAGSIGVLIGAFAESEGGAVVAARAGEPDFEPLCAVYPTSCLATVVELLESGERAARALFQAVGGVRVQGASGASVNVNSAADLAEVTARLQGDGKEVLQ
jgi:molybdenum cofactor cytidylyltransferase